MECRCGLWRAGPALPAVSCCQRPYKPALQSIICRGELGWAQRECQDAAMCTHLQHMGDAMLLQKRPVCLCLTAR